MAEASKPTGTAAFVEGLYGKLPESWASALVAPSAVFWVGLAGLLVIIEPNKGKASSLQEAYDWTAAQPQMTQLVLLFGVLSGVSLSALVVESIVPLVQKVLAGQWYLLNKLGDKLVDVQDKGISRNRKRWEELAKKIGDKEKIHKLTAEERLEYDRLDTQIARIPAVKNRRRPTRLGNILESSSSRPEAKYGLYFDICWPRIWLLLVDAARTEVTQARNSVSTWIRVWIWGLVFVGASLSLLIFVANDRVWWMAAWPLAGAVIPLYAHHRLFGASEVWADTIESCFDLYRKDLYMSLRWPLPIDPVKERSEGERLSIYLWRGSTDTSLHLTDKDGVVPESEEENKEADDTNRSLLYRLGRWLQSID